MATAVGCPQRDVREHLLRRLDTVEEWLASARGSAATFVDHDAGVDELRMVLEEPFDTIGGTALLVRGQHHDDVAIRNVSFLLQPEDVRNEDRGHRLVVGGPAAVVIAVALRED